MATYKTLDDIHRAIGTIMIDSKKSIHQTCFMFSTEGFLLSAGHGFHQHKYEAGSIFKVNMTTLGIETNAQLLEYKCDSEELLDYSVLQLLDKTVVNQIKPLVLSTEWKSRVRGKFDLIGYKSYIREFPLSISGSTSLIVKNNKIEAIQLNIQSQTLSGLSGGPVLVSNKGTRNYDVIGVQSEQFADKNIGLAIPISRVKKDSAIVSSYVQNTRASSIKLLGLDPDIFIKSDDDKFNHDRYFFIAAPTKGVSKNIDLIADDIFKLFGKEARKVDNDLNLVGIPGLSIANFNPEIIIGYVESSGVDLEELFKPPFKSIGNCKIRGLCDLTKGLINIDECGFEDNDVFNHITCIKLCDDQFEVYHDGVFDISIKIPDGEHEKVLQQLSNSLIDIYYDCKVFESIPILVSMFSSNDLRKEISKAKVEFCIQNDLTQYGMQIPNDAKYVSFASCCRHDPFSKIDLSKYNKVWHGFIEDFLFPPLLERKKNTTIQFDKTNMLDAIRQNPRMSCQINFKRLSSKIDECTFKNNQLYALVIFRRKCKDQEIKKNLHAILGRSNLIINSVAIVPQERFGQILKCRHYVKLFLFRG